MVFGLGGVFTLPNHFFPLDTRILNDSKFLYLEYGVLFLNFFL